MYADHRRGPRAMPERRRPCWPTPHAPCVRTYSARTLLMSVWYPTLRRFASFRKRARTSGSSRMAISRRAWVPSGGRPTRRIARSCASDASGRSEKSIFLRAGIRRPFFSARSSRSDDPDRFDISRSLIERDVVLGLVGDGLALVPFEHSFKYIHKSRASSSGAMPTARNKVENRGA
jgi:hypothetical protein